MFLFGHKRRDLAVSPVEVGRIRSPGTAREIALTVILAVEQEGAYVNLALNQAYARYNPPARDRAFITELVYGTVRRRNTLDWALKPYLRRPSLDAVVLNILRLGAYQLIYLERVPASAACNESAQMTRRMGFSSAVGLVNAVLRSLSRSLPLVYPDPATEAILYLSLYHSHPQWLVTEWSELFGYRETQDLLAADNRPAPFAVRTNTLKITRAQLAARLTEAGITATPALWAPEGLYLEKAGTTDNSLFQEGLYFIQDEAAMLVSRALAPAKGSLVIDLCGAPGGKTTHLATLMEGSGRVLSVDIHPHRLALLEQNVRRLGLTNVAGHHGDARCLPEYHGAADFVLVDAPCSGLGVLRRRPDLRWRKSPSDMAGLVQLQAELLDSAALCLKPGGVLVYSTCTIRPQENELQVANFLDRHADFHRADLYPLLPEGLTSGHPDGPQRGELQLLPHRHTTDGFFLARLVRLS